MHGATFVPADRLEGLVHDSLVGLQLDEGLAQRVNAALPGHDQMLPALRPALRVVFGGCAAVFAVASWILDLPRLYGAGTSATYVGLGAILLGAAIAATAIAVSIFREVGPQALVSLRGALAGVRGRAFVATLAAVAIVGTGWFLLDSFDVDYLATSLRAARATLAMLAIVVLAAAVVQGWIIARKSEWRPALPLVEAAGLVVAAIACAANYAIYVA
jgi:hypothetical protein